jgi:hypothetical protein
MSGIGGDHAGTAGIALEVLRGPGSVGIALEVLRGPGSVGITLVLRGSRWRCSEGRDQWGSRWYCGDRAGGAQRAGISGDRAGTAWITVGVLGGSVSAGITLVVQCHWYVSPAHPTHAARGQPERSRAFCLPWLPFGEIGGCQGRRCTKKFGKTAGPLCTMRVGHPRARGSNPPKEKKFFFRKKFPSRKGRENRF